MNPPGMFKSGKRLREHSAKDTLSLSGKLIPEFDRRQNIRDMFNRKPSLHVEKSVNLENLLQEEANHIVAKPSSRLVLDSSVQLFKVSTAISPNRKRNGVQTSQTIKSAEVTTRSPKSSAPTKRSLFDKTTPRSIKRAKSDNKGQQSLKGFFKSQITASTKKAIDPSLATSPIFDDLNGSLQLASLPANTADLFEFQSETADATSSSTAQNQKGEEVDGTCLISQELSTSPNTNDTSAQSSNVHDPIESKESWSKLFAKPVAPRCEGHNEPCITLLTKKNGMNCGRSFWICARPLGPTGTKERNTQWRCQTFIWCSDWNGQE